MLGGDSSPWTQFPLKRALHPVLAFLSQVMKRHSLCRVRQTHYKQPALTTKAQEIYKRGSTLREGPLFVHCLQARRLFWKQKRLLSKVGLSFILKKSSVSLQMIKLDILIIFRHIVYFFFIFMKWCVGIQSTLPFLALEPNVKEWQGLRSNGYTVRTSLWASDK